MRRAAELLPSTSTLPFLHGAEGPDQRQKRRLARPGGARHDHDLAAGDFRLLSNRACLRSSPSPK